MPRAFDGLNHRAVIGFYLALGHGAVEQPGFGMAESLVGQGRVAMADGSLSDAQVGRRACIGRQAHRTPMPAMA